MDKIIDFLKRSNRYKHLIGGFLVGICALSGQTCLLVYFVIFAFEIFGCARQYEQALLHSLARKFGCARHSPNKFGSALACT
ncbi:MAG: hypothetical protein ACOCNG_03860, partial [Bacteroidales bacterium]